ncbi:UPF0175 family protein [Nostocales cyanobacterium LEGE 11386]|nr:UPF0175 family protein [Nostocales cyanobacterium LEGE 11386]
MVKSRVRQKRQNKDSFLVRMGRVSIIWDRMTDYTHLGEISQAKAAEIAGLTRTEFIHALSRYQVDFMQYTAQELADELANVD